MVFFLIFTFQFSILSFQFSSFSLISNLLAKLRLAFPENGAIPFEHAMLLLICLTVGVEDVSIPENGAIPFERDLDIDDEKLEEFQSPRMGQYRSNVMMSYHL